MWGFIRHEKSYPTPMFELSSIKLFTFLISTFTDFDNCALFQRFIKFPKYFVVGLQIFAFDYFECHFVQEAHLFWLIWVLIFSDNKSAWPVLQIHKMNVLFLLVKNLTLDCMCKLTLKSNIPASTVPAWSWDVCGVLESGNWDTAIITIILVHDIRALVNIHFINS